MRASRLITPLVSVAVTTAALCVISSPPSVASLAWADDPCETNGGQVAVAPDMSAAPSVEHPMAYVACADGALLYHGAYGRGTNERIPGVEADTFVDVVSAPGHSMYAVTSYGRITTVGADAEFYGDIYPTAGVVAVEVTESGEGYWIVTRNGEVFGFGDATDMGPAEDTVVDAPIVAFTADGSGGGWVVTAAGQVVPLNGATDHGSVRSRVAADDRVVGIVSDRRSGGFWVVTREGRVIETGGAPAETEQATCQDNPGGQPPFSGAVGDYHPDASARLWIYSVNGGICGFNPGE
ncbi:hypothetical protein [Nocardioides sp. Soil796]|uniref:hypothetical protein n=1 Tax=Nocardioides sp. Soil796 TaxID=1736412 RepID=UPI00070D2EE2|nr:hypothetical protein [Nocardioides sp. Soil796]KRF16093.1 hypothetical protein ASH02_05700 [Nocardioides sp. Soil796]